MSQLFACGGPSIGVSASASVLPMNSQDLSPLGWTGWISLQSKGLLQHNSLKASIFRCSAFFIVQLSHPYMTTGKMLYKYLPAHSKFKFCFSKLFFFFEYFQSMDGSIPRCRNHRYRGQLYGHNHLGLFPWGHHLH